MTYFSKGVHIKEYKPSTKEIRKAFSFFLVSQIIFDLLVVTYVIIDNVLK